MQDQHNNSLIDPMGECTQCLLNLVVIGRATPYLHNGEMQVEQEETGEVRSKAFKRANTTTYLLILNRTFSLVHFLTKSTGQKTTIHID
jgi:hypothetical protein